MDLDLDPHGSAFIFLSLIRIRIDNADPDSGALKLIQITNTFVPLYVRFPSLDHGFGTEETPLVILENLGQYCLLDSY